MSAVALLLSMIPWIGICADMHGTLSVTDLSQASLRPAFTEDRQALDLETLPIADVTLQWPKSRLSFGYGPRLLRSDVLGDERATLVLHVARASYSYSNQRHSFILSWTSTFGRGTASTVALAPPPAAGGASAGSDLAPPTFTLHSALIGYTYSTSRSRYTLTESGTLGRQSLAAIALAASPSIGSAPSSTGTALPAGSTPGGIGLLSTRSVTSASEATTAAYSYLWTHRWQSTFSASYSILGGFHRSDQEVLPQQRAATVATAASHRYTRVDTLISTLSITHTDVERGAASAGLEDWIGLAAEAWNRRWSRDVNSSILLGAAVTSTLDSNGTRTNDVGPSVSASVVDVLLRRRDYAVTFMASTSLAPGINPLTGQIQTRLTGLSTIQWASQRSLLAASGDATQTLPADDPGQARLVGLSLLASHELSRAVTLAARYRLVWQDLQTSGATTAGIGIPKPVIWIAALLLTLRAPSVDF